MCSFAPWHTKTSLFDVQAGPLELPSPAVRVFYSSSSDRVRALSSASIWALNSLLLAILSSCKRHSFGETWGGERRGVGESRCGFGAAHALLNVLLFNLVDLLERALEVLEGFRDFGEARSVGSELFNRHSPQIYYAHCDWTLSGRARGTCRVNARCEARRVQQEEEHPAGLSLTVAGAFGGYTNTRT